MTWWSVDEDTKHGYNEKDGEVTKYHRTKDADNGDHDHEFYDTKTGVTGYHGYDCDRKEYGKDYQDFANNNGKNR